ncbi:unnamed protein product [Polarella glacialis]|uniref:CRAL-TRIO domain-containing protein n=1 Tax=Polarella glacialis TaxID=89957 RepID=A0A813F5D7_POLGL|nr:unnamed protein product [Polarella glacialis]
MSAVAQSSCALSSYLSTSSVASTRPESFVLSGRLESSARRDLPRAEATASQGGGSTAAGRLSLASALLASGIRLFRPGHNFRRPPRLRHALPSAAETEWQQHGSSEEDLNWIDEASERESIETVRTRLLDTVPGWPAEFPEDMVHDIQIARFLRGHSRDPEQAAAFMARALAYRQQLLSQQKFQDLRRRQAGATEADLGALPRATGFRAMGICAVEGLSEDGLPVALTAARLLDFDAIEELMKDGDDLDTCLKCMIEQRALVLHNLSVQQRRMVKFIDVRDLTHVRVLDILGRGRGFVRKIIKTLALIQDFYPETVHKILIYNVPSTFDMIFGGLIAGLLNKRMRSKFKVYSRQSLQTSMAERLGACATWSWLSQVTAGVDFHRLQLGGGGFETAARWLGATGQTVQWRVQVLDGPGVTLRCAFMPSTKASAVEVRVRSEPLALLAVKSHEEGTFTAPGAGVLIMCLESLEPWWGASSSVLLRIDGCH